MKSTKAQRIANTIQNTLENMQEEEDKISAHAEQLNSNRVLSTQQENERRENAVEGLRKKLDELNGYIGSTSHLTDEELSNGVDAESE